MSAKILVTGATGTIGKALVKQLQSRKAQFVIASRDPEQSKEKLGYAENVVRFDYGDPATFEDAVQEIDRVFLLGPPLFLNIDELLRPFIDFLNDKGIKKVVYISAQKTENMGEQLAFHTIIENKLDADNFDYTVLKPAFFSQNFKNYEGENILQRGIAYSPAGEGKVGFIDVNDIANVAATILSAPDDIHQKKVYELTGPELLSYNDAAALLTEVIGKPIFYPNPSAEEYTATLKVAGAPDFIAPYMISVYSLIARNEVNYLTDVVEQITGKKPSSLKSVLEADFSTIQVL